MYDGMIECPMVWRGQIDSYGEGGRSYNLLQKSGKLTLVKGPFLLNLLPLSLSHTLIHKNPIFAGKQMPAGKMGFLLLLFLFISLPCLTLSRLEQHQETIEGTKPNSRTVIDVEGGPDSVVWVVQLSDLHFSVFHPDRADDLKRVVGPSLALINPSLVLITGDLTGILLMLLLIFLFFSCWAFFT